MKMSFSGFSTVVSGSFWTW